MRSTGGPLDRIMLRPCEELKTAALSQFSNLRPSFDAANENVRGFNWLEHNAVYTAATGIAGWQGREPSLVVILDA